MTVTAEEKKCVVTDLFEEGWNLQQFASFSDAIGESVVFNFRNKQQITNFQELKGLISFWKNAFPDLHFEVIDIIAEDNLVAANLVFTGTHLGPWLGFPPSGNSIRVEEMMFFRFEGEKIVELWEVFDEAEMEKQIKGSDAPKPSQT